MELLTSKVFLVFWSITLAVVSVMDLITSKVGLIVLSAVIGIISTWFWRYRSRVELAKKAVEDERRAERKDSAERFEKLEDQDAALRQEIAVMTERVEPLRAMWATVQTSLVKDLTHPSEQYHEMDELLKELEVKTITGIGHARLAVLLDERITTTDPHVSPEERLSAKLMRGVMTKVVSESLALDSSKAKVDPAEDAGGN